MLTLESLAQRSDRFVAQQIYRQARSLAVKVLSDGPLHHVPIFNKFVRRIASLDGLRDFFVKEDDLTQLHC